MRRRREIYLVDAGSCAGGEVGSGVSVIRMGLARVPNEAEDSA